MCSPVLGTNLTILGTQGKAIMMLIGPDGVHALLSVADTIKNSSRQAIKNLHALGIKTVVPSGDSPHTVEAIV